MKIKPIYKITITVQGEPKKDCLKCDGTGKIKRISEFLGDICSCCYRETTHNISEEEFVEKGARAAYDVLPTYISFVGKMSFDLLRPYQKEQLRNYAKAILKAISSKEV